MSYNPSDHAVEPQRMVAAWALCAAILAVAFGASIISDNDRVRETLLARPGEEGAAVTKSSWFPGEHGHTGTGCADKRLKVVRPHERGAPPTSFLTAYV